MGQQCVGSLGGRLGPRAMFGLTSCIVTYNRSRALKTACSLVTPSWTMLTQQHGLLSVPRAGATNNCGSAAHAPPPT